MIAVFGLAVFAYATHAMILLYGLLLFPPFVFLVNKRDLLFALCIALYSGALTLPGIPFSVGVAFLLVIFYSGLVFVGQTITKKKLKLSASHRWIIAFVGVMVVTAFIRGFGLRKLGGDTWGGAPYVVYTVYCIFYLFSTDTVLPPKYWRWMVSMLCLLALVPVAAQALYAFSGGMIWHQFLFILPEYQMVQFMQAVESDASLARLHVANVASQYLFMLALVFIAGRKSIVLVGATFLVSGLLGGISGNRIPLIYSAFFLCYYLLFNRTKNLPERFINRYTVILLFLLMGAMLFVQFLPPTFQRWLSWIPGVHPGEEVAYDAALTVGWRWMVWRECLRRLPQYLLIGRGFAFNVNDLLTMTARTQGFSDVDFVVTSHNYHQGLLSVVMDLGLPGFLCWAGFVVSVVLHHFCLLKRNWNDEVLKQYHRIFFAAFCAHTTAYFLISGGHSHFVTLIMWAMVAEGLVRTDMQLPFMKGAVEIEQKTTWANLRSRGRAVPASNSMQADMPRMPSDNPLKRVRLLR